MGILIRLASSAAALWVATLIITGITVNATTAAGKVGTLVAVAVIFGLVNAILKPVVKMVGCGLYVFTLGLIALVVNGLLFLLTSWIAGQLSLPFHVANFWPAAVLGALLVAMVSWVLSLVLKTDD